MKGRRDAGDRRRAGEDRERQLLPPPAAAQGIGSHPRPSSPTTATIDFRLSNTLRWYHVSRSAARIGETAPHGRRPTSFAPETLLLSDEVTFSRYYLATPHRLMNFRRGCLAKSLLPAGPTMHLLRRNQVASGFKRIFIDAFSPEHSLRDAMHLGLAPLVLRSFCAAAKSKNARGLIRRSGSALRLVLVGPIESSRRCAIC
jgi:hypothetical protein